MHTETIAFHYRARTPEGRPVSGIVKAINKMAAVESLQGRPLFVSEVEPVGKIRRRVFALRGMIRGSVTRSVFFRSVATLVDAGIPIQRAFAVIAEQTADAGFREAIRGIVYSLESGDSLSIALSARPMEFPPLHVALIRAGESGGMLSQVLNRIADLLERGDSVRKKLIASLSYPGIILVTAISLIAFLFGTIVPNFGHMYSNGNTAMPLSTRVLISVGRLLNEPRFWMIAAFVVGGLLLVPTIVARERTLRSIWDSIRVRIPLVGNIIRSSITARVARTLGSLLNAGVGILSALELTADASGHTEYADAMIFIRNSVEDGESFSQRVEQCEMFDPLVVQLVRVGEESGRLPEMLAKVADHHEREVETAVATLGTVIEPILIGVLGLLVGIIVFSIFAPLYAGLGQVNP
ncbi:MAG TPA: type II secretion system F family protein [Candidatus Baltobacteraceae bacterium]|jgi:type II secretory pathway component PulF|nr:type II secretion system F family protein [Candidatus Baltobacteraceae bacterium]